jgi:hypothetical protein
MNFHFTGMRRSGNHAILLWLITNIGGTWHWRNNWTCPLSPTEHWYRDGDQCDPVERPGHSLTSIEDEAYTDGWLVLRDVYNVAASRIEAAKQFPPQRQHQLAVDERFAATWLQHVAAAGQQIVYNQWFSDAEYREHLLVRLGGTPPERRLDTIAWNPGVVSAFTSSLRAAELGDVLRRYEKTVLPQWLLDREDVRAASLSTFGWAIDREGRRIR